MGMYVQLSGKHRGPDKDGKRKTFTKGDIVELTTDQAAQFKDKFKPVEVVEAEAAVLKAQQEAIARAAAERAKASQPAPAPAPAPTK